MSTITAATRIGLRGHQEDRYLIHRMVDGVLLAVMDGHGGQGAVEVSKDYLPAFWDITALTVTNGKRPFDEVLRLTIAQLATITAEYRSGTTVSLAFVPRDELRVYFATVGDSPAIMRDPLGTIHTSISHNVRSNFEERQAAMNRGGIYAGGFIWSDTSTLVSRPYQFVPASGLQMGRALGDGHMGPVISKQPDVGFYELGDFILLATHGALDPAHAEKQAIADIVAAVDAGANAADIIARATNIPTGDNATCVLLKKEKKNLEKPEPSATDRESGPGPGAKTDHRRQVGRQT